MPCVPNNAATFLCDGLRAVCPSDRGAGPAHSVIDRHRWNPYGGMVDEMAGQQLISALEAEAPCGKVGIDVQGRFDPGKCQVGHWSKQTSGPCLRSCVGHLARSPPPLTT